VIAVESSPFAVESAELVLLIVGVVFTLALGGLFAFVLLRNDDPGSAADGEASDEPD
jgi:hypothetical protein